MEPEVQAQRPVLLNRCHFDRQTLLKSYKQLTRTFTLIQTGIALLILAMAIYYTVIYFPLFTQNPSLPVMVALIYLLGGVELWRAGGAVPAPHQKMPQAQNGRKERP